MSKQKRFIYVHRNFHGQVRTYGTARRALESCNRGVIKDSCWPLDLSNPDPKGMAKAINTVNQSGRVDIGIYENPFTAHGHEWIVKRELE